MILAGIDIGTNTLRLLIADIDRNSFHILHSSRTITRLGEQLDRTRLLSDGARRRSCEALAQFAEEIRRFAPKAVAAVGTSALRTAANASAFIQEAGEKTGLQIRVITGEEEARLTLQGVVRSLPVRPALIVDIGGGSTEIISPDQQAEISLPLGAVYLTDRFIHHDPPLASELSVLRREVHTALQTDGIPRSGPGELIGTAGTITTLASMDQQLSHYDPDRITGHVLSRNAIDAMIQELARTTVAKRRFIPGLEQGREDIILAGAIVAEEIMDHFRSPSMVVSDWGLREGIVLDLYDTITMSP